MSVDLRQHDPNGIRFNAIAQSIVLALVGCIVGLVAAGVLVGMNRPLGWMLAAAGAGAGLVPLARWSRDRRRIDHVDLFDIDHALRPLLQRAAIAVDRIERAATTAPNGPVSELLEENHGAALAHVKLMEHDARSGSLACRPEMLRLCHQLHELAETSERLMHTALEAQPTVLNSLVERTNLVIEALRHDIDTATDRWTDERPIAASDERDHAGRDATNDR